MMIMMIMVVMVVMTIMMIRMIINYHWDECNKKNNAEQNLEMYRSARGRGCPKALVVKAY